MQGVARVGQQLLVARVVEAAAAEGRLQPGRAPIGEGDVAPLLVEVEVLDDHQPADQGRQRLEAGPRALLLGGDHQRDAGLVDEQRIRLVDEGEGERALDQLRRLQGQAVPEEVEPGLLGGDVGDVGGVGPAPLDGGHPLLDLGDLEAEQAVERAHPGGIAPGQVVVEGQDVGAGPGQ